MHVFQQTPSYPVLGVESLDRSHRMLMEAFADLKDLPDDTFIGRYPRLVATIENDFRHEEKMMEKLDIPSLQAHMEQHARALSALHHAASSLMRGDVASGRSAIMLLIEWFPLHIETMDRQLAIAIRIRLEHRLGICGGGND